MKDPPARAYPDVLQSICKVYLQFLILGAQEPMWYLWLLQQLCFEESFENSMTKYCSWIVGIVLSFKVKVSDRIFTLIQFRRAHSRRHQPDWSSSYGRSILPTTCRVFSNLYCIPLRILSETRSQTLQTLSQDWPRHSWSRQISQPVLPRTLLDARRLPCILLWVPWSLYAYGIHSHDTSWLSRTTSTRRFLGT